MYVIMYSKVEVGSENLALSAAYEVRGYKFLSKLRGDSQWLPFVCVELESCLLLADVIMFRVCSGK